MTTRAFVYLKRENTPERVIVGTNEQFAEWASKQPDIREEGERMDEVYERVLDMLSRDAPTMTLGGEVVVVPVIDLVEQRRAQRRATAEIAVTKRLPVGMFSKEIGKFIGKSRKTRRRR